jgi:cytochrome c2
VKTRIVLLAAAVAAVPSVALADAAEGKSKFESACADCHELADFAGRSATDLTATLKGIVAGKVKHKGKIALTDAEIADLVAHLSGSANGAKALSGATSGTSGTAAKQAAATGRAATATEAAVADPAGTKARMPPMSERPGSVSPAAANPAAKPATVASSASSTSRHPPPASTPSTAAVGGTATSAVATTTGVAGNAAVTGAGKGVFDRNCSKCHEVADFAGQPAADLQERLGGIVAGKVKHKPPLKLSDAERQSLAAYLSAGR